MLIDNYSSCAYIDGSGGTHDVNLEDFEEPKSELLCKYISEHILSCIKNHCIKT